MKKTLSLILTLTLIFTALPTNMSFASSSGASSWAKTQIDFLISKGAIPKHLQSNYQKPITRLEFCQLLVPILRLTQTEMGLAFEKGFDTPFFTDVDTIKENLAPIDYFKLNHNHEKSDKLVDTSDVDAYKLMYTGIIKGTGVVKTYEVDGKNVRDHKFEPNSLITREQAAIMMVNTISKNNEYTATTDHQQGYKFIASYKPISFADKKNISQWAIGYVTMAVNNELISGVGNNKFDPKGNLTREQAMVMAYRVYNIFINDKDFYDRVTKSNDGYIYTKYEESKTSPIKSVYAPLDLARFDVEAGRTSKLVVAETKPEPIPIDSNGALFIGDLTTFIGKSVSDVEKVFGTKSSPQTDFYGLTSYNFLSSGVSVALNSGGSIVGISHAVANSKDSPQVGFNVFGKIKWDTSADSLRNTYKIVKEGESRRDLLALYRMYPEFPGYMVEVAYNYPLGGDTLKMVRITVYKGDFKPLLDSYQ